MLSPSRTGPSPRWPTTSKYSHSESQKLSISVVDHSQVGVADDHVVAGGDPGGGPDRRALAGVARVVVDGDPGVVDALEDLPGPVPAAVVDDHQLDLARVLDVEDLLDRGRERRLLVVNGHEDGQLHGR